MIGALSPHVVSADAIVTRRDSARMHFVACCSAAGCGCIAGAPQARSCTRTDCGLSDRHHNHRNAA